MFDNAADVVQRLLRQTRIFVTGEQVYAVLGQGHVAVHAGTVIAKHWFWHKGRSFTEAVSDVVNHIFVDLNFVRFFGHGVEAGRDFVLTSSRYFVVMRFNDQAHFFHDQTHGRTDVLRRIYRRNREVTAFHARTVTFVTTFVFGGGVPCAFDIIDSHVGTGNGCAETDVVKQEELWLWPEQNGICDAGRTQVLFSAFSDGARVAVVALQRTGFEDIATDDQGRLFIERVDECCRRIWHQNHV